MPLSKSDFMLYLRHPGWLWLKKHNKEILPIVDTVLQSMFDEGNVFEQYASQLFPSGVRVGFSMQERNYGSMPVRTMQVIKQGASTIFQGRLEAINCTCIFDVITRVGDSETEFDLYEIKSSTSVKVDHIHDLAFQTIVLEEAGLTIRNIYVIYVNNEYARSGEIDVNLITKQSEVTQEVRQHLDETRESIKSALLVAASPTPPDFSPRHVGLGALKEWLEIHKLLHPAKHEYPISKLTRISAQLYVELEDLGVDHIANIPETLDLHPKQKTQITATKNNARAVDTKAISSFLESITYPLYFLDYETYAQVIPQYDGFVPYQQVPFQYSLHILSKPNGEVTHKEFLHLSTSNPVIPLVEQLQKDIDSTGTVLVWYEKFEKTRNTEMGKLVPEYAPFLEQLNNRIIDLMVPFSTDLFIDKDFYGSASIKKVLPVLIPELSHKDLAIQEGMTASLTWKKLVFDNAYLENKDEIISQLLEYCKLDTLAMVKLFQFLVSLEKE